MLLKFLWLLLRLGGIVFLLLGSLIRWFLQFLSELIDRHIHCFSHVLLNLWLDWVLFLTRLPVLVILTTLFTDLMSSILIRWSPLPFPLPLSFPFPTPLPFFWFFAQKSWTFWQRDGMWPFLVTRMTHSLSTSNLKDHVFFHISSILSLLAQSGSLIELTGVNDLCCHSSFHGVPIFGLLYSSHRWWLESNPFYAAFSCGV